MKTTTNRKGVVFTAENSLDCFRIGQLAVYTKGLVVFDREPGRVDELSLEIKTGKLLSLLERLIKKEN